MSWNKRLTFISFSLFLSILNLWVIECSASANSPGAMVSAANPYAVRAAVEILRKGGSAVDAAIAAQMVLNLVEPQSSGIGGGGFMLHWDNKKKKLSSFDGRETAPFAADGNLFAPAGKPMKWADTVVGGLSVGTPGLLAMLEKAHKKHGKLKWKTLFEPAINLSKNGFSVSPRLSMMVEEMSSGIFRPEQKAHDYFFADSGKPVVAGAVLRNPAFAKTLEKIAKKGVRPFYRGAGAENIVRAARKAGGLLSSSDLRSYRAVERSPVCSSYRKYIVCGMGPPTSGGIAVIQILKIVERFDMASLSPMSPEAAHVFTQAARLAYADRDVHIADPDFHPVPVSRLTDSGYLKKRSDSVNPIVDMGKAASGIAGGCLADRGGAFELPSTTHISVVDGRGDAVSMTSSIENAFGSTLMAGGFLLNNQLTDFSFSPRGKNGCLIANRVEPGKRPRSSMAPTMVFDENGELRLVIGSPGGSRIINYVARTIIAVVDWGMDVQSAVNLPHYVNRNGKTELELGSDTRRLTPALVKLGHEVEVKKLVSGLHAIEVTKNGLKGGADPRREGVSIGIKMR